MKAIRLRATFLLEFLSETRKIDPLIFLEQLLQNPFLDLCFLASCYLFFSTLEKVLLRLIIEFRSD